MRDPSRAFIYYQKSAASGFRRAQFNLGCMYYTGHGVTQDEKKAHHFFKLSADKGERDGMYQTALMYSKNFKDYDNAIKYFFLAVVNSHEEAHKYLLSIFCDPEGCQLKMAAIRYLSTEWPQTHKWLNDSCKNAICELFLCLKANIMGETPTPTELIILITKELIIKWPNHTLQI